MLKKIFFLFQIIFIYIFSIGTTYGDLQKDLINKLHIDVEVTNQNILKDSKKLSADVFVARAFKPLKNILHLLNQKAVNWKKIFLFLGKSGRSELLQASKSWDIEYKQRVSVTSDDSIIVEVNKLKKK